MDNLPAPVIVRYGDIDVVRDDLIPGGTKIRALILSGADEFVYASPAAGYAQVALAIAAAGAGKRATVFVAQRRVMHARTREAQAAGAKIVQVPCGYMNVVTARAKEYCARTGARLMPFGFDTPDFIARLSAVARALPITPREVWTVAGSGVLSRALQAAWPGAEFHAVRIGAVPKAGRAHVVDAPEKFERDAKHPPPFPSCGNYDAKAWQFIQARAKPGALFWNVAG